MIRAVCSPDFPCAHSIFHRKRSLLQWGFARLQDRPPISQICLILLCTSSTSFSTGYEYSFPLETQATNSSLALPLAAYHCGKRFSGCAHYCLPGLTLMWVSAAPAELHSNGALLSKCLLLLIVEAAAAGLVGARALRHWTDSTLSHLKIWPMLASRVYTFSEIRPNSWV